MWRYIRTLIEAGSALDNKNETFDLQLTDRVELLCKLRDDLQLEQSRDQQMKLK